MILDSSMVEHTAVNRGVVGSSPTRGARPPCEKRRVKQIRLRGQAVKTSPFHGGNTGSIPVGVIYLMVNIVVDYKSAATKLHFMPMWLNWQSS